MRASRDLNDAPHQQQPEGNPNQMTGSSTPPRRSRCRQIRHGGPVRALRGAVATALLAALSACAGAEGLPGLAPPQTSVQPVPENAFPTLGAPPVDRRDPLTPEAQQKLQSDLERLARTQSQ